MSDRGGHNYTNSYIAGEARAHLGDVYNNYGPSPDERLFLSVLESLRYDGMDDRRDRLNSAGRGTFRWTLHEQQTEVPKRRRTENEDGEGFKEHSCIEDGDESDMSDSELGTFATWLGAGDHDGLFCFFGKPGSGKSTLMYVQRSITHGLANGS